MDINDFVTELKDLGSAKPSPDINVQSMEIEVLSQNERRDRCFDSWLDDSDHPMQNWQKEIKRKEEIRQFLSKETQSESNGDTSILGRPDFKVYRYASEVKGLPISITSALTGDRVYCEAHETAEEETLIERKIMISIDIDQVREKIKDARLSTPPRESETAIGEECWMLKYAPKSFSDLVTDDKVNREVLKWLKGWTPVNPRSSRATPATPKTASNRDSRSSYKITDFFDSASPREAGAPEFPALTLVGRTGVGKSSLVNIAARMCKYHPFVIDSVSDRSREGLEATLEQLMLQRPVKADGLPPCIIFDEIDTLEPGVEARQTMGLFLEVLNGQHKRIKFISRPVIFICTEMQYAFLAPLKKLTKVLYMPQPAVNKSLVLRLQTICSLEGLDVDLFSMQRLVEESRNDISACLNALQFQSKSSLDVGSSKLKSIKQSPFDVWETILIPDEEFSFAEAAMKVSEFGDLDLVTKGVFGNYPRLNPRDEQMRWIIERLSEMSSLMCMPDYVAYSLAGIRQSLLRSRHRFRIEWPSAELEASRLQRTAWTSLGCFLADNPRTAEIGGTTAWATDILPYAALISRPPLPAKDTKHLLSGECRTKLLEEIGLEAPDWMPSSVKRQGGENEQSSKRFCSQTM